MIRRAGTRTPGPCVGLCALAVLAALTLPTSARAIAQGSPLAFDRLTGDVHPELLLAQRAIERTWGPSDDSTYVEESVPGWRSDALALALSAAVPGAGHAYVGETSGLWFALAEAAGWTAKILIHNRAEDLHSEATHYLGAPNDSSGTWSFERWQSVTSGDVSDLEALYRADPDAFYRRIGMDDRLLAGWDGDPTSTRATFESLRERSDVQFGRARVAGMLLWINHVAAAFDAMRAARIHNFPLQRNLELKVKSSWRSGSPGVMAVVQRRF
jgi:hypothetical protein